MTKIFNVTIEDQENPEVLEVLIQGVRTYNSPYFGPVRCQNYTMYVRDENQNTVGGIAGFILYDHLRINWAWVSKDYRGQGLGSQLLRALDTYALSKGCTFIQLDTYDFQAKPFYEKNGYVCVGTIEKWLYGRDCHFLRKILQDPSAL